MTTYNPSEIDILKRKKLFVKHPTENINLSQKKRAEYFLSKLQQEKVHVEYCDNKNFKKGSTEIIFSMAVFHGTSPKLGYVVEVFIKEGRQSFLFSSDVEGPGIKEQAEFILDCNPKITYIDGPMTYMLGYRYSGASLQASIKNLLKIVENTQVNTLILDHHLLRDLRWRDYMNEVSEACRQKGCEFLSAALYSGKEELMLEARRKILYEKFPVKNRKGDKPA